MKRLIVAALLLLAATGAAQSVPAYGGNAQLLFSYKGTANGATAGNPTTPPSPMVRRNCTTSANQDCSVPVSIFVAGDTIALTGDTVLTHNSEPASLVYVTKWLSGNYSGSFLNSLRLFLGPSNSAPAWCTGGNAGAGPLCYPAVSQPPLLVVFWYYLPQATADMCKGTAPSQCKFLIERCTIGGTGCKADTSNGHITGISIGHEWFMWTLGQGLTTSNATQDAGLDTCSGGNGCVFTVEIEATMGGVWRGIATYLYRDISTGCGMVQMWHGTDAGGWTQLTVPPAAAPTICPSGSWPGYGGNTGHFEQQYLDFLFNTISTNTGANALAFTSDYCVVAGPPSGLCAALKISAPAGW